MDVTQITTLVSTLGFPIVMCLLMAWYFTKRDETMTKALNDLTAAVNKLCARMEADE